MSMKVNMRTASKKELADLLIAIAAFIQTSSNKTVGCNLELTFNDC